MGDEGGLHFLPGHARRDFPFYLESSADPGEALRNQRVPSTGWSARVDQEEIGFMVVGEVPDGPVTRSPDPPRQRGRIMGAIEGATPEALA